VPKRLTTLRGACPSLHRGRGGKILAHLLGQERIHLVPLSLQERPHQGVSCLEGALFEGIQTGLLGEATQLRLGQVHGGELGHLVGMLFVFDPTQEEA
jgi:hypothetical protein